LAEAHAGLIDSCEIGATLLAKSVEHLQTGDVAYLQSPDAETQALMEQMKANSQTFVKALQAQADRLEVKLPYPLNLPFDQRAGVDEPSSPDEEIDRLKEQLRASPGDSATLLALGEAFQQQGAGEEDGSERQVMAFAASAGYYEQYAATLQESTEATDKQRKLDVLSTLAGLYANLQQYDKLVSVYGRITELRPSDADNYLYYGQAAQNAGRNDIAIMAYRKFLMLAPNSTYANDVKEILDELVGAASPDSGEGP
jgi:tetratricopeptide (TPR) repeat protein